MSTSAPGKAIVGSVKFIPNVRLGRRSSPGSYEETFGNNSSFPALTCTRQYYNSSVRDIVVVDQMNHPSYVLGSQSASAHLIEGRLVVKDSFPTPDFATVEKKQIAMRAMADAGIHFKEKAQAMLVELREAMTAHQSPDYRGHRMIFKEIVIDHYFKVDDLVDHPNGLYDPHTGLLFVLAEYFVQNPVLHPYSQEAMTEEAKAATRTNSLSDATTEEITVVANDGEVDSLYGYSLKRVNRYKAVRRPGELSGVYVWHRRVGDLLGETGVTYYTFEQAKEHLALHSTQEEAASNGRPDLLLELEKASIIRVHEEAKRESELNKQNHEAIVAERKMSIETRKSDNEVRKEKADIISSALKLCGVIVGAIISIAGLLKLFF